MPDDLWRNDIHAWSLQQAERLRRLRAGERVNDLDWDNVIEEIESVGRSQLDAVESLLIQAVLHLLKARSWPRHPARRKWLLDADEVLAQAQRAYRPSMARVLDLPGVLSYAMGRIPHQRFTTPADPMPDPRPIPLAAAADPAFRLDDLEAAIFPAS